MFYINQTNYNELDETGIDEFEEFREVGEIDEEREYDEEDY